MLPHSSQVALPILPDRSRLHIRTPLAVSELHNLDQNETEDVEAAHEDVESDPETVTRVREAGRGRGGWLATCVVEEPSGLRKGPQRAERRRER